MDRDVKTLGRRQAYENAGEDSPRSNRLKVEVWSIPEEIRSGRSALVNAYISVHHLVV